MIKDIGTGNVSIVANKPMIVIISTAAVLTVSLSALASPRGSVMTPPPPVIFIHGIGANSSDWRDTGPAISDRLAPYYKTAGHPSFAAGSGLLRTRHDRDIIAARRDACVYVSFADPSGHPAEWARELADVIDVTRRETASHFPQWYESPRDVKVNLVAHSMGGLAARYYLVTHPRDHGVSRLLMISTPHQGSAIPRFRHLPLAVTAGGIGAFFLSAGNPLFLAVAGVGVVTQAVTRSVFQIKPHGAAAADLETGSDFLKNLNAFPLPPDVSYGVVVSRMDIPGGGLFDTFMGHPEGSDGAISLSSQRLSTAGIPNFAKLRYQEFTLSARHMDEPTAAQESIITFLDLGD